MATEVVSREAQREFPRWPVSAAKPVRVDLGPAGSGQTVDISAGGMRVKMMAPLRRDAEIPVRIDIPDQTVPVQCSGIVVWSKPNGSAGIRFTKMSEENKAILTSWLKTLEQSASESSPQRDEFTRITAQITAMKLNNADALSLIARRASQLGNATAVLIAIGKPENMICLARSGDAPELGTHIRQSGLIGECARGRKPVLVQDASTDPRGAELKNGSAMILPLLVNTELRGVMQIVCAEANALDTKTVELLQKLADAVIFVTHNVMPHRPMATIRSLPKPVTSSAPLATKASDSGRIAAIPDTSVTKTPDNGHLSRLSTPTLGKPSEPTRLSSFSAPTVKSASDSGRLNAYSKPLKPVTPISAPTSPVIQPLNERSSTIEVAPLAEAIRPVAATVAAKPAFEVVRPLARPTGRQSASAEPFPAIHPRPQSSSKAGVLVAAVVVLVAGFVGGYFWHHQQQSVAVATSPKTDVAAAPASTVPQTTEVTITPVAQPVTAEITPAAVTSKIATKTSLVEAPHVTPAKASVEKKVAPVEPAIPKPVPMQLASGRPVERPKIEEPETAAPSATQLAIHTTSSIPGIALPSSTSAPKLTAPVAKTWTGGSLVQRVSPVYPQAAIARGLEGPVQLIIVV
ncbi:MAG TPA: PilZ domain-containing protein, partial [Terriglobales bacterium]|nr:PilZ domain-containing protein [Terriglobales bacterium]